MLWTVLTTLVATPVFAESEPGSFSERFELETTFETTFERLGNRDLDGDTADALSELKPEISVEIGYQASNRIRGFMELEAERTMTVNRGQDRDPQRDESELNLKQIYLDLEMRAERLSFRIGRQEFEDRREWLYDEELDGIRAFYRGARVSFELSATRQHLFTEDLLRNVSSDEPINNYMLYGSYQPTDDHQVSAYALLRDSRSDDSENPIFYGLRAAGAATDALDYWLELANVRGRHGANRLRGHGLDLGASYRFEGPLEPSITLGYAFGSGDSDADDAIDRNFRQTGLQDNAYRFNGVEDFRYYGETLDPELSNLSIATIGLGIRPSRRSSVDLVYHRYRQAEATKGRICGARVRAQADGESRDLGQAIDLILGYHEISPLRLRAKLGYFMPGKVFGVMADDAYSVELGIEYEF